MTMFLRIVYVVVVITAAPPVAMAADSGWKPVSGMAGYERSLRTSGDLPVSLECRNASSYKGAFKPEFRVTTAHNPQNRNWAFFAMDQAYEPGEKPADGAHWKKMAGNVLSRGTSGNRLHCALFHHKEAGSFTRSSPPIWRKVNFGYVTKH